MANGDKATYKLRRISGTIKAATGRIINDHRLEAAERADQRASQIRDAGRKPQKPA
jgi:uncharacterized protein YjbJ (UPF0337 family)